MVDRVEKLAVAAAIETAETVVHENMDKLRGPTGLAGKDGRGISFAQKTEAGDLLVRFTDGETANLGRVAGRDGVDGKDGRGVAAVNKSEDGELTIRLTDGETVNLGRIVGKDGLDGTHGKDGKDGVHGKDGRGVAAISKSDDGHLLVRLTDGETVDLGRIVGKDGRDGQDGRDGADGSHGKGIFALWKEEGELVAKMTDGEVVNLGRVVGDRGEKGESGRDGRDGVNGVDGRSIKAVRKDGVNLLIDLDDGETVNLGDVRGEKGEDGVGVVSAAIDDQTLTLRFTNGEVQRVGNVVGRDGRDGAPGLPGRDGRSFNVKGLYEAGSAYMADDIVSHKGSSWTALRLTTEEPDFECRDWSPLAHKGDKGDTGETGTGVKSLSINGENLVVELTDGSGANLGKIVGRDGINGKDGRDGVDGRGVTEAVVSKSGRLSIIFSDGEVKDLGSIRGPQGPMGDRGERGAQGERGRDGKVLNGWKGKFLQGHEYDEGDVVRHGGGLWMAKRVTRLLPDGSEDWELLVERGPRGPAGKPGPVVAPIVQQASLADSWRGQFRPGESYRRGDLTRYAGQTWLCLVDTTHFPEQSSGQWDLFAARGKDGKGGKGGSVGSPFEGIDVYNDGVLIRGEAKVIDFRGVDVEAAAGQGAIDVVVYVPPAVFNPTFGVSVKGGTFNGLSYLERGASASAVSLAWSTNDAMNLPLVDADQVRLNGADIALDAGWTVASGGDYIGTVDEGNIGGGFSVRLSAAAASVTRTASLSWRDRSYWGFAASATPGESDVLALEGSALHASRAGSYALSRAESAQKYLVVALPAGFSAVTTFKDASTNLEVPFGAPDDVMVTNAYGAVETYKVYRSANPTATTSITLLAS